MSSVVSSAAPEGPLFRAVASSTRQIYQLLKCISFVPKVDVHLTHDGIRFTADHARSMQGVAFLDQSLFTTFTLNCPDHAEESTPRFQLNLSALLETLQIFGATDAAARAAKTEADPYRSNLRNYRPDAFSHQTLGMAGTCTLVYEEGSPLAVILEESGVKTQCNITTYTPDAPEYIPFDRSDLVFKIIMQARWLLDALSELSPMAPSRLKISAVPEAPYLKLSGGGDTGSASVDFSNGRELLEVLTVAESWVQSYKFDLVRWASEAMRIGSKVSFRGDRQGVLSLQFMVENEGGTVSFLDFRFIPYTAQEEDESESESDDDDD
ncbi:DNA repair exonuclease rad1 [Xylariaceae sp. FL1019]|nr:DNA repair exonuclease rad1 [Xylariaceae sp. FL1019]